MLKKNSDTQTVCIRDDDVYRLYVRMWSGPRPFSGQRIVGHSQSARFSRFSDPIAVLSADKDDSPNAQFYNSATTKLASNLYLMLPSALLPNGTLPVYAAFSRDGKQFRLLGHMPFCSRARDLIIRVCTLVPGLFPATSRKRTGSTTLAYPCPTTQTIPQKCVTRGGLDDSWCGSPTDLGKRPRKLCPFLL